MSKYLCGDEGCDVNLMIEAEDQVAAAVEYVNRGEWDADEVTVKVWAITDETDDEWVTDEGRPPYIVSVDLGAA